MKTCCCHLSQVAGIKSDVVLRAIGLHPERAKEDVLVLVGFYVFFVLLSFVLYARAIHRTALWSQLLGRLRGKIAQKGR